MNSFSKEHPLFILSVSTFNVSDLAPMPEIVMTHALPGLSSNVNKGLLPTPPVLSPLRHEYVELVLSKLINAARDKVDRRFLVHWQGQPSSNDTWISEDALRRLRPELIQPLDEIIHTHLMEPSSFHLERMMGDHPDNPTSFHEDRISVCVQPQREARTDMRDPNFKYSA